jgi:glyoxylase-like metal-dependent hydrolase (beta-lactamase superfamily II)
MTPVREILPGLHHWTALHEGIGFDVNSYFVAAPRVLIDPMLPSEELDWFREGREPELIALTNRHHYRMSDRFVEAFDCAVACHRSGLNEFEGGPNVKGFSFGDELAPGVTALEMGSICPDDSVLRIAVGDGALAFADALVHWGDGKIGFVPDQYMDDPPKVKQGVRESARRLLDESFDALLFAHGEPIPAEGRAALETFLAE